MEPVYIWYSYARKSWILDTHASYVSGHIEGRRFSNAAEAVAAAIAEGYTHMVDPDDDKNPTIPLA